MADPFSGNVGGTAGTAWLSDITAGIGIGQSLAQGGTRADVQAATSAAKLTSNLGGFGSASSSVGSFAGDIANLTNIISGVQQGGVSGYTGAGINAAALLARTGTQLAGAGVFGASSGAIGSMASEIGAVAGPLAGAYSIYQFAKNWQSGSTGADALSGAQAGATIGTAIMPGIGTVAGAVIGGAVGAISSAFGGGKADPETMALDAYAPQFDKNPTIASSLTPAQNMTMLQGVFDAKNNSPGHSTPLEQYYGRMNSAGFVQDIFGQINSAMQSGKISPIATPQQIYSQVVAPYLASKTVNGQSLTIHTDGSGSFTTAHGSNFGGAMQAAVINTIGQWQSGQFNSKTVLGAGNTINVPAYAGTAMLQALPTQLAQQNQQQQLATLMKTFPLASLTAWSAPQG
jgi:hypothetical protein